MASPRNSHLQSKNVIVSLTFVHDSISVSSFFERELKYVGNKLVKHNTIIRPVMDARVTSNVNDFLVALKCQRVKSYTLRGTSFFLGNIRLNVCQCLLPSRDSPMEMVLVDANVWLIEASCLSESENIAQVAGELKALADKLSSVVLLMDAPARSQFAPTTTLRGNFPSETSEFS
eukprot:c17499_g1_i1.p1 GENE.c17499_g1_i1~~c17499_g1_i1.p1  ORF type:complete len:175 (+),score=22.81 c17499_g1_i1:228-752(+)